MGTSSRKSENPGYKERMEAADSIASIDNTSRNRVSIVGAEKVLK